MRELEVRVPYALSHSQSTNIWILFLDTAALHKHSNLDIAVSTLLDDQNDITPSVSTIRDLISVKDSFTHPK